MHLRKIDLSKFWWIYGIFTAVALIFFSLAKTVWVSHNWIPEAIGLIGTFASLAGIVLALTQIRQADIQIDQANRQIKEVSKTTEATNAAVLENKAEIKRFLSFAEVGHLVDSIHNTQNYISKKDMNSALILMKQIKDNMLRTHLEHTNLLSENKIELEKHISNITVDIQTIVDDLLKTKKGNVESTMHPNEIHHHLEEARSVIITIESLIKKQTL